MSKSILRFPSAGITFSPEPAEGPEAVVLKMNLLTLCELLGQLGQPNSPPDAAVLRQRVTAGESMDHIIESFAAGPHRVAS